MAAQRKVCIVCRREFPANVTECPDDLVRLTEKDARIGTIFDGKYEILDFVGSGGMSRVYKARHTKLNRIMALKILRNSELVEIQRFRQEAVSIGKLEHPNIARVYAFAVSPDGRPYMALEYLDGQDLSSHLARDGALSLGEALQIFDQVASALQHAHNNKIIHRDIKPSNIVLLSDRDHADNVKVVDFGLAKVRAMGENAQRLTQDGEIFGTKQYVGPELFRGAEADERSDIFSMGVSLKEAVLKNGKIPETLSPLISKACNPDPDARFQNIAEFRSELEKIKELQNKSQNAYVNAASPNPAPKDLFGTFYFWTMLSGMIIVGICATVVVKQRMDTLESISNKSHKTALSKMPALSLSATRKQADALILLNKKQDAITLYLEWLARNRKSGRWNEICQAEQELSALQEKCGMIEESYSSAKRGLIIAERHPQSQEYKDLLFSMSRVEHRKGNFEESIRIAKERLALAGNRDFAREQQDKILVLHTIANSYRRMGDFKNALDFANEAESLCRSTRDDNSYANCCKIKAVIYEDAKNYKEALANIEKSVEIFRQAGDTFITAWLASLARRCEIEMKLYERGAVERDYNILKTYASAHGITDQEAGAEVKLAIEEAESFLGLRADSKEKKQGNN
ncbi:MAG: protein kinase [Candidatus Obscuribacterales bacterium]|nr:protein kinase [Candidatus Obscuribacterales bacterium]